MLGGGAQNVFKRIVAWADGWMPIGVDPEQVKMGRATLDELADAAGRDPDSIKITVYGQPADTEGSKGYEDAGADRVTVRLASTGDESALTELERMAEQVLA